MNVRNSPADRHRITPGVDLRAPTPPPPELPGHDERPGTRAGRWPTGASDRVTPVWFQYIVIVGCTGVLSFGGLGLLLAVTGHFTAAPAFSLGAAGTAITTWLARPERRPGTSPAPSGYTLPAVGAGAVAVGVATWNAIDIGHNVVVESDPGVYLVAGRWLASHPSLLVPANGPWADKGLAFNTTSPGLYHGPNGTLGFLFAHLLPVLLAEGHQLGGDALMFRVPAVVGALALCAIYTVGCRIVRRPWLVLAAVTALAVSTPQLYMSRDTFSETATQVLLWGGIWLLLRAYEERRPGVALVAGLALGGTLMTRIDAVAYLIPLPPLVAVSWLAGRSDDDRRSLLGVYGALVAGVLPPAVLGTFDVQRRATGYYDSLHHQIHQLYLLLALSVILAGAVMVFRSRWSRPVAWFLHRRRQISIAAAGVVGVGLILAWTVRPLASGGKLTGAVGFAVANVQRAEHLPVRPETYAEDTVRWLSWYLGPITMVLAIAGLGLLTMLALWRGTPAAVVVLAMTAPLTAIYLWTPNITPLQIWAMRRYVPATLPLLVLAAAVAIDVAASASGRWHRDRAWPPLPRLVAAAGGAAMIVFPISTVWPVRSFDVQTSFLPLIEQTCRVIGPNAAVVFPDGDYDGVTLAQTLRSWCDVPVTGLTGPVPPAQLADAAAAFQTEGKNLWVLAGTPVAISQTSPALTPALIATATSRRELEQTVDRAPKRYAPSTVSVYGAKVP